MNDEERRADHYMYGIITAPMTELARRDPEFADLVECLKKAAADLAEAVVKDQDAEYDIKMFWDNPKNRHLKSGVEDGTCINDSFDSLKTVSDRMFAVRKIAEQEYDRARGAVYSEFFRRT